MGIHTEYQAVIQCDFCYESDTYAWELQRDAIRQARKSGWSIGKKVKCPKCRRKQWGNSVESDIEL